MKCQASSNPCSHWLQVGHYSLYQKTMFALAVMAIWPESPMIECDCWECWVCAASLWLTCRLWESIERKCRHSSLSRCDNRGAPRRWSRPIRVTMAGRHGQHWQMICGNYQHIVHSALPYYISWRWYSERVNRGGDHCNFIMKLLSWQYS